MPESHEPPQTEGESVLGAIAGAVLKQGLFKRPTYTLVVTNRRIIAARLTNEMLKNEVKQASADAKAAGKGLGGRWMATMGAGLTFHERYVSMPPDQALGEDDSNFAMALNEIKSVRSRTYLMPEDGKQRQDELIFSLTAGGKRHFKMKPNTAADAAKTLRPALGDRVK